MFSLMGSPPQPKISVSGRRLTDAIWVPLSMSGWLLPRAWFVFIQPKTSSVQKVCAKIDAELHAGELSRDEAGKLRGDTQWLFSSCNGSAARFAGPLLQRCQYGDDPKLSDRDQLVLQGLRSMAVLAVPRDTHFWTRRPPCTLVYTDASFEAGQLRLGWIIFAPPPYRPHGGTCLVPDAVLQEWTPRKQQIFPCEALCLLVIPLVYAHLIKGRDLLWFIDNQAAVAAAVKSASTAEDAFEIAQMASLLRTRLACRGWFEWIDSDSNPSDGLSRDGLADEWSCSQDWFLQAFDFPAAAFRDPESEPICCRVETVGRELWV